jgi:hypothetical protein
VGKKPTLTTHEPDSRIPAEITDLYALLIANHKESLHPRDDSPKTWSCPLPDRMRLLEVWILNLVSFIKYRQQFEDNKEGRGLHMPNNRWNEDAEKVFFSLFVYPDLLLNRISRFVVICTKLVLTSILFTVFFVCDEQGHH